MQQVSSLDCLTALPAPEDVSQFHEDIDPEWIETALHVTGTATIRKRRLPAAQVIWLVIGMALFRNKPITEVASTLDLALPAPGGGPTAARSAISQARGRLGEDAIAWLFLRCAEVWAHASAARDRWHGLALYSVDGTTLRVPDSDPNRAHFGLASAGARGSSGYPLVRLAALVALRSHLIADVAFGPYTKGELTYAGGLWSSLPDNSLVIVDANFLAAAILLAVQAPGESKHWLVPAKKTTKYRRLERFGRNDELVEMSVSREARKKDPSLPKTWTARAIRYQRKGFKPRTLLTSLTDPTEHSASDIVKLYHERWEIELAYAEMKTDMLDATHQPLRSHSPVRVRQEIWGILIAYNLIRLEMERIADEAGVAPTRISFTMAYQQICMELMGFAFASPGAIPKRLRDLRSAVKRFVLPPRRQERSFPRAVKVKMSNFAKKRRPISKQTAKSKRPK